MIGRRDSFLLALLLIFALGSFSHTYLNFESSNELSRLYLAHALAFKGTTEINSEISEWGPVTDKSVRFDKYYSDKAPGASWVAALPSVLMRISSAATGRTFDRDRALSFIRIMAVAFPCLIFFIYMFEKFNSIEFNGNLALGIVVTYALGSQAWVYSTLLYGHNLAAAALFTSYLLICPVPSVGVACAGLRHRERPLPENETTYAGKAQLVLAGLLLGMSVALDYVALWGSACLLVYIIVGRSRLRRGLNPWFWLGLAIPVAALLAYNWVSFGGPLTTGYSFKAYSHDAAVHAKGILGISFPEGKTLFGILSSHKRGLFYWSPWLLFALPGFIRMARLKYMRADFALFTAIVIGTIALVGGFSDWTAGWSFGPRHLSVMVPFLLIPIMIELKSAGPVERVIFAAFSGISIVATAMAVITFPHLPALLDKPFTDLIWPLLASGNTVNLFGSSSMNPHLSIALGGAIALAAIMWISVSLGDKYGRKWKAALFIASITGAAIWVAVQANSPGQDDSDSHFSMSQVYAAVGDLENTYNELVELTGPENTIDLRVYTTYKLWKMSPEMGKFAEALRWQNEFDKLKAELERRPPL